MNRVTACILASGAFLASCATETAPVCRAPQPHEMAVFRAVISHNETALASALAPGATRNALLRRDPTIQSRIWGANGETRGSMLGMLSQPPLCVLDDPTYLATDTSRQVVVYPQHHFDRVSPAIGVPVADAPFPYGVMLGDYMTCRFEQTETGLKLSGLCGFGETPGTAAF
jgi:hypothetical protein